MPTRTVTVRAPLFMRHKGIRVYHVYKNDDADCGNLRTYTFTLDPVNGSDDDIDGVTTFDVRSLSTWVPPIQPPYLCGVDDNEKNRRAWDRYRKSKTEEEAIADVIRRAIEITGEIRALKKG